MRLIRRHPEPPISPGSQPNAHPPRPDRSSASPDAGGRLNLLLSAAGWQPDPWVDRLPRILEPIGVQSHVAASARTAQRVIESNPIHIAVVDLALPLDEGPESCDAANESGVALLDLLARLPVPPPTVVIKRRRSARDDRREIAAALKAGAFAVVDRPNAQNELEMLLEVLGRCLNRHYAGRWPNSQPPGFAS